MKMKFAAMLAWIAVVVVPAAAQQAGKRPLTHNDYDSWRTIQAQQLSRDGKFLAYALIAQDGDGEVVVRNLATGNEWRVGRGARPVAPPPGEAGEPPAAPPAGGGRGGRGGGNSPTGPTFTADGRFVIFQI